MNTPHDLFRTYTFALVLPGSPRDGETFEVRALSEGHALSQAERRWCELVSGAKFELLSVRSTLRSAS